MIRTDQTHLPVVALTHPGMTGKNNEDRYAVNNFRLRPARGAPVLLAVLSDGIGGHRAGEVAAQIAVDTITEVVGASNGGDPTRILQQAIEKASQAIYQHAQADESRKGMGATCAVAWIMGRRLYAATVGDSRLYLLRGGTIRQLSTDHTWVQEALDRGYIQPEQARSHPNAHVIRRYLGSPTPPKVDFRLRMSMRESDTEAEANQGFLLQPGDRLVLCSDGLTDMVPNQEILAALDASPMEAAARGLVERANSNGGLDNITLIAIEIPGKVPGVPVRRRAGPLSCLGVVIAALVMAGLVLGGLWYLGIWSWPVLGGVNPQPTGSVTPSAEPSLTQTSTPTVTQPAPEVIRTLPTLTPTRPFFSSSGATLTPWPTSTPGAP